MAENSYKYTCIFGGGAVRGFSYIGAKRAMEEVGIKCDTIAGSSVGAIFAAMYAVGFTSEEMKQAILNINFELFKDLNISLGKNYAFSKGEVFLNWIRDIIEKKFYGENYKKGQNPAVKFKDLDKNLVIFTTDLLQFKCQEFSKTNTPDFEVAAAVKISSSMPGLMTSTKYEGMELVDGDLQKSWALWQLSDTLKNSSDRILEFRLEGSYSGKCHNLIDFVNAVYSCVTSIATKSVINQYGYRDDYDYITIDTKDVVIFDFNISKQKREELIEIGYNTTLNYLKLELPAKKQQLLKDYKTLNTKIKHIINALTKKDVKQAQCELGQVYMFLYSLGYKVDRKLMDSIETIKYRLFNELKPSFFFKTYPAREVQSINEDLKKLEIEIDEKITEFRKYVNENK